METFNCSPAPSNGPLAATAARDVQASKPMTGGGSAWYCLRKFNFGPEQDGSNRRKIQNDSKRYQKEGKMRSAFDANLQSDARASSVAVTCSVWKSARSPYSWRLVMSNESCWEAAFGEMRLSMNSIEWLDSAWFSFILLLRLQKNKVPMPRCLQLSASIRSHQCQGHGGLSLSMERHAAYTLSLPKPGHPAEPTWSARSPPRHGDKLSSNRTGKEDLSKWDANLEGARNLQKESKFQERKPEIWWNLQALMSRRKGSRNTQLHTFGFKGSLYPRYATAAYCLATRALKAGKANLYSNCVDMFKSNVRIWEGQLELNP